MTATEPRTRTLPGSTTPDVVRSTLLLVPDAALWVGPDDRVRATNERASAMFRGDVVGRAYSELVRPATDGAGDPGRTVGVRCDGVPFAVETSVGPAAHGAICTLREPAPAAIPRLAQQHFDAAFQTAPIGMALFDPDGRYIRVNEAIERLLGRPREELLGRRDQEFTHPDDRASDVEAAWEILRGERSTHQCEKRFVRPDGTVVWAIANLAFLRDEHGRPISWVGQFQDITARRGVEEDLRRMADRDPLTGLMNRRAFDRELAWHLAGPGGDGGLLVADLDGFKAVNDALGHRAGDDVLVRCAAALAATVRAGDLVARLGGDEFAVFALGATGHDLEQLADRLADAIRDAVGPAAVGASVGAAATVEVGRSADALFVAADARMYAVKTARR